MTLTDRRYPRFARRLQAGLYDVLIIGFAFFVCAVVFAQFELQREIKIGIFAVLVLLLEPGLVSLWGSTIGHRIVGLRVVDLTTDTNIGFFRATLRFILKILLGWLSLIFIMVTQHRHARHDLASTSSVIVSKPDRFTEKELIHETPIEVPGYVFPSRLHRVLVIFIYIMLIFIGFCILGGAFVSEACFNNDAHCLPDEQLLMSIVGGLVLAASIASLVYGWRGQLFGARRKPQAADRFS